MKKHSIKIQGHSTSISLEEEFWAELKKLAKTQKRPMSQLIAEIDKKRGFQNLSSALRVYVLKQFTDPQSRPG